jgi:hypothetical protein
MPAKTGGSHALAGFSTLVVGSLLSKYLWAVVPSLGEASLLAVDLLRRVTGASLPVTEQFAGSLVVMVGLSFLWGVLFHLGRRA